MLKPHDYDLSVYLLQGGGALGSYQMGVLEGLLNHGCAPNWIVGTSIGAINAAIVAGNHPENRVDKLKEFWRTISTPAYFPIQQYETDQMRKWHNFWSAQYTLLFGQRDFFTPNVINPWFIKDSSPDKISFYDTKELIKTLEKVVDFDLINQQHIRLTLSSVCVEEGELVYFDNTRQKIEPMHVMASGALPPGFPAVKIEDKHYWDGGVNSNTPFSVVLDEKLSQKIICFLVNLFPNKACQTTTMLEVLKRKKDIHFSSRHQQLLQSLCEIHTLQHKIHTVLEQYEGTHLSKELIELSYLGHPSALNFVHFQYKDNDYDLVSKDYEFSYQSIQDHYQSGLSDVQKALLKPSWLDLIDDDSGVKLHEF